MSGIAGVNHCGYRRKVSSCLCITQICTKEDNYASDSIRNLLMVYVKSIASNLSCNNRACQFFYLFRVIPYIIRFSLVFENLVHLHTPRHFL